MRTQFHNSRILGAAVLTSLLSGSVAFAEGGVKDKDATNMGRATGAQSAEPQAQRSDESREAKEQVTAATEVLSAMKRDAGTKALLEQAQGLFIVPQYARGAAVVGARGGEGVLVVRNQGDWAGPIFYDYGGLSVGAQAGGQGGSIVMLLMSERAIERFKGEDTDFALNADAGLTIVEYSENAQASLTNNDIVVWSDTEGLFAGVAIGVTGVRHDPDDNRAYYDEAASTEAIIMGSVTNPHAERLHEQLPGQVASR